MATHRPIVCGIDFSECAEQALEVALELASAASSPLTLVHVCEPGALDLDDGHLRQCEEALFGVVARHRHRRVDVMGVLRCGKPWMKLDNVAAEVGARLIVIGRHGAGRGRSVGLGAVADHLVRLASRPALIVPFESAHEPIGAAPTHPL